MSLAADRTTAARQRTVLSLGVAAAALCYAGGLAAIDSAGNVKPGATALGLRGLGRFRNRADNSAGAAGDITAEVELGVFLFANSAAGDAITAADIDKPCYIVDDQTVARTDGASTRSIAGTIADIDDEGVWVDFLGAARSQTSGKVFVTVPTVSLKAADAGVARVQSPVAGKITKARGVCGTAVTGADATAQVKIAGVNVTGGLLTWPLAGAAIGQAESAVPTAANTVAAGDVISVAIGGGGTQTGNADIILEITL